MVFATLALARIALLATKTALLRIAVCAGIDIAMLPFRKVVRLVLKIVARAVSIKLN